MAVQMPFHADEELDSVPDFNKRFAFGNRFAKFIGSLRSELGLHLGQLILKRYLDVAP